MYFVKPRLTFLIAICMGAVYGACPVYTEKFDNSCYYFSYDTKTWYDARTDCRSIGSRLAIVETLEEDNFLTGVALDRKATFWLDGTDLAVEKAWRWSTTRTNMTYTNWDEADGEPDNKDGGQDCLAIHDNEANTAYLWFDLKCGDKNYYVCESDDTEQDADLKCAKDLLDEMMKCKQSLKAGCKH